MAEAALDTADLPQLAAVELALDWTGGGACPYIGCRAYNLRSRNGWWRVYFYAWRDWTGKNPDLAGELANMPAGTWVLPLAVGERAGRGGGERHGHPRVGMAGQERRIDDTLLIREAQRGDRGAFEELVRHYDQPVLRLALHLTGSEAEAQDVYQDAFLKAYKNLGSFRFECSFYTWIYRIVTNLCLDHLRRRKVRKEEAPVVSDGDGGELNLLDQVADGRAGANPERDLMRRQLGARIAGALEKLTPRERMVFELKHYHGLKLRTVGEILHTTEETAKNTLFRATQKLRGELGDMR